MHGVCVAPPFFWGRMMWSGWRSRALEKIEGRRKPVPEKVWFVLASSSNLHVRTSVALLASGSVVRRPRYLFCYPLRLLLQPTGCRGPGSARGQEVFRTHPLERKITLIFFSFTPRSFFCQTHRQPVFLTRAFGTGSRVKGVVWKQRGAIVRSVFCDHVVLQICF